MLDINAYVSGIQSVWYFDVSGKKKSVTVLPWNDSVNGGCIRAGGWIGERERDGGKGRTRSEKKIASDEWKMSVRAFVQINGGTRDFVRENSAIWNTRSTQSECSSISRDSNLNFQDSKAFLARGDPLSTIITRFHELRGFGNFYPTFVSFHPLHFYHFIIALDSLQMKRDF